MDDLETFRRNLANNGVIGYSPSDLRYLLNVARACVRTAGIPSAGAAGVALASVSSVAVPGVGAVPGWVAGALAGFVGGTAACTIAQGSLKPQLDQILAD